MSTTRMLFTIIVMALLSGCAANSTIQRSNSTKPALPDPDSITTIQLSGFLKPASPGPISNTAGKIRLVGFTDLKNTYDVVDLEDIYGVIELEKSKRLVQVADSKNTFRLVPVADLMNTFRLVPVADLKNTKYAAVVRIFFATDRNLTGKKKPDEMFGVGRSSLTYGTCDVSIPRDHRMGELESPSIMRFEVSEDPTKHVVLRRTDISSKDEFFANVAARVRKSQKSSALLFVHGYNVTFADAARRTAQLSYDLGFDGVPAFYSWPSQGTAPAYIVDEQNIEWAQANIKGFLEEFFRLSDAQSVYLIGHSMGNRALTRAVGSLLTDNPALRERLKEVILTAPDIDAEVFKRDIAPALAATGRPITLYASSEDLALDASKMAHGYPRAGDSGEGLVVVPGIETIDATGMDTSFSGHSYFAESRSILSDIFYLLQSGQRADQRFGLRRMDTQAGRYWVFKR